MDSTTPQPSKGLHYGLWAAQILLGVMFTGIGLMKVSMPSADIPPEMPEALLRFIGISELAGGIGVVLPAATRIKPVLTPLAAVGLLTIMILAALLHASKGEFPEVGVNVVIGALASFVAWGRFRARPIAPRR